MMRPDAAEALACVLGAVLAAGLFALRRVFNRTPNRSE